MNEQPASLIDFFRSIWLRLLILVVAFSAVGYVTILIGNIQISADTRVYFNEDNENLVAFDKLEEDYSKDESVYIVIESVSDDLFSSNELKVIRDMTENSWLLPYVSRVDSLTNYQYTRVENDDLIVEDLFGENIDEMSSSDIAERKKIAAEQPELIGSILSENGRVTAINLAVVVPGENKAQEIPQVVSKVRDFVASYEEKYPQLRFHIGGQVFLNYAFAEISQKDIKTLYPIMLLVILLMLFAFFRMIIPTIVTVVVVVLSCVGTLGVAGLFEMSIASIVINAPIMVMSLALADCVHILVNFYNGINEGKSKFDAMKASLEINFKAVSLTTLTTAIGFLSLNFSESPPFRDLGNLVAVGVFIAYFLSLTVLPILMTILPSPKVNKLASNHSVFWDKLASIYGIRSLTFGFVLIILISSLSAWSIKIDDTSTDFFSERTLFRQDAEYIEKNITGVSQINYTISAGAPNGVTTVEYLTVLNEMVAWLREQKEVTYVSSIIDIVKRLNKDLHAGDRSWYKVPESSEMVSQYLLLYEMSLPYGLDLTNRINLDKSASRLIINLEKSSAIELLDFDRRVGAWLEKNAPPHMLSKAASPAMMFAYVSQNNARSMIIGMLVALALISLILVAMLKSFRLGIISLIMNCTPIIIAFGLWSVIVGEAGLGVSLVLGVSLGIVVDNSIHFLSKYRHANIFLEMSESDSIDYALRTVGKALLITTVSVTSGFIVISLSDFSLNSDMGVMTSLVIGIALVVDLVFIPPILKKGN